MVVDRSSFSWQLWIKDPVTMRTSFSWIMEFISQGSKTIMTGCMGALMLKKIYNVYKDLELDHISFLHTFSNILNILKNDKSLDRKIFLFFVN
jgi:hypothetical protein